MADREEQIAEARAIVDTWGRMCHRCRAGFPNECAADFDRELACPDEKVSIADYLQATGMLAALTFTAPPPPKRSELSSTEKTATVLPAPKYDSGYVDQGAWVFRKDIGEFTDPGSTGRKAAKALYPIQGGQICDWAWKKDCGGAVVPVMGCPGHPASDLHHGPDKNTLNNAKATRGVGGSENMWIICSFCHNAFHAANDEFYPPYDRVEDQARPWLPVWPEGWVAFTMQEASAEEILAEELRRKKEHESHGITRLGRNAHNTGADLGVSIDDGGDADGGLDIT